MSYFLCSQITSESSQRDKDRSNPDGKPGMRSIYELFLVFASNVKS